jgi:hypothetical protein
MFIYSSERKIDPQMLKQTRNTSNKKNAPNYSTVTRLLPHAVPAANLLLGWAKKRDKSDTYILFIGEM